MELAFFFNPPKLLYTSFTNELTTKLYDLQIKWLAQHIYLRQSVALSRCRCAIFEKHLIWRRCCTVGFWHVDISQGRGRVELSSARAGQGPADGFASSHGGQAAELYDWSTSVTVTASFVLCCSCLIETYRASVWHVVLFLLRCCWCFGWASIWHCKGGCLLLFR